MAFCCDVCGRGMDDGEATGRLRRIVDDVMIEVMVRYRGVWNAGHVCHGCVLRVATHGGPAGDQGYTRDLVRSLTPEA